MKIFKNKLSAENIRRKGLRKLGNVYSHLSLLGFSTVVTNRVISEKTIMNIMPFRVTCLLLLRQFCILNPTSTFSKSYTEQFCT